MPINIKKVLQSLVFAGALLGGASALPNSASAAVWACDAQSAIEITGTNARVVVKCNNPFVVNNQTVQFVAIAASSSVINRFVEAANAAVLSGLNLYLDIPPTGTSNAGGCAASDCRTPTQFGIFK